MRLYGRGVSAVAKSGVKVIARNKKALHDYHIEETYEAGIVLTGTEIKSIRQGRVNLRDSFARIEDGEVYLLNMHISPYEQGNRFNPDPTHAKAASPQGGDPQVDRPDGRRIHPDPAGCPPSQRLCQGSAALAGKKQYDKRATSPRGTHSGDRAG